MRKYFLLVGLLAVSITLGCGNGEIKPSADSTAPMDTSVADKAMQDMSTNPNVPPEMKERMKRMPGGVPGGPPGGAPAVPK